MGRLFESPILIVGTGRCGTTALANTLAHQSDYLYVDEPNFITHLYIPFIHGQLTESDLLKAICHEGWRGPMKICRSLSESYPHIFDDNGTFPIRQLMRKEIEDIAANGGNVNVTIRKSVAQTSVRRIVKSTTRAANKLRWLVKQPNAVLFCTDLLEFWPSMKVIHVTRRLPYIIQSRVVRKFQTSVDDALNVCLSRLLASLELDKMLGENRVLHLRIEDFATAPKNTIVDILNFLGEEPEKQILEAACEITLERLCALGKPEDLFSKEDLLKISIVQQFINQKFGKEVV